MPFQTLNGKLLIFRTVVVKADECCCECPGCFFDLSGEFTWTFSGTCNGVQIEDSGTITDGGLTANTTSTNGGNLFIACTGWLSCDFQSATDGVVLYYTSDFNGPAICGWVLVIPGDIDNGGCAENRPTLPGTYNLETCLGDTGTLEITPLA